MKIFGQAEIISEITNAVDSSGEILITTFANHGMATGHKVLIVGVGGTTEANGYWTVTSVTATTFKLNGSTFTNVYTSGGGAYKGRRLLLAYTSPTTHLVHNGSYYLVNGGGIPIPKAVTRKLTGTSTELMVALPNISTILDEISVTNPSNQTQDIHLQSEMPDGTIVEHLRITGILQYEQASWNRGVSDIKDPTGNSRFNAAPPIP